MATKTSIGPGEIAAAVTRLAAAITSRHGAASPLLLLGIANGGIELARRLAAALGGAGRPPPPVGTLDISFHRDDIGRHPIPKEFAPTQIPADVHGAHVILVDDVLFSGRTVKAALDELFDHGRPARVELAVLVDRGGRRLPLSADYVGFNLDVAPAGRAVVHLDPAKSARDTIRILPAGPLSPPA